MKIDDLTSDVLDALNNNGTTPDQPLNAQSDAYSSDVTSSKSHRAKLLASYDTTQTIREISEIPYIDGGFRIIPKTWDQAILLNGKKDNNAIALLAEIVSWYRSKIEENESTGELIGYSKKFKADMFQCSMLDLAYRVGITKNQTIPAIHRLEKAGLIIRDLRNLTLKNGSKVNNVQFLAPVSSTVRAITVPKLGLAPDKNNPVHGFIPAIDVQSFDLNTPPQCKLGRGQKLPVIQCKTGTLPIFNQGGSCAGIGEGSALQLGTYTENLNYNLTTTATPTDAAAVVIKKEKAFPVNLNQADSVIDTTLTCNQKLYLKQKLQTLPEAADRLERLIKEVECGLLDPKTFNLCGKDFGRKVGAIMGAIKRGEWIAPAVMHQMKIDASRQVQQSINHQLILLKEQYQTLFGDYCHFGRLSELTPNQALHQKLKSQQLSAWDKIQPIQAQLIEQAPDMSLQLLPKPVVDEAYAINERNDFNDFNDFANDMTVQVA